MPRVFRDVKIQGLSSGLDRVVGPALMVLLAIAFLADRPEYMVGIIHIEDWPRRGIRRGHGTTG